MRLFALRPMPNLVSELFFIKPVTDTLLLGPNILNLFSLILKCSVLIIFIIRDKDWCNKLRLLDESVISSAYLAYVIFRLAVYPAILRSSCDDIMFDMDGDVTAP